MSQAAPGHTHHDEVQPIPWLGKVGEVDSLDRAVIRIPAPPVDVASGARTAKAEGRYAAPIAAGLPRTTAPSAALSVLPRAPAKAPAASKGAGGCGSGSCGCASKGASPSTAGSPASNASASAAGASASAAGLSAAAASDAVASVPPKASAPPKKKGGGPKRPGSGIPARPVIRTLVWVRRFVQVASLALFTFLLVETTFRGSFAAKADTVVRMPYAVEGFLLADPFVAAMTFLSSHTVYRGLLWSVALLGLTLVFGRVFCGWICPFGTLHHFFAWIFPSTYGRGNARVNANHTHGYQRIKYYLMYAFLAAALAGSAIGGLFDPICICVRAIGLAVLPAVQYVGAHGLGMAATVNERHVQFAADGAQDFLARSVWQSKQFYFHETWFIGFLLIATLFMNRFIPRFWCRVLCPLGAFLGVFARFALFGMEKDHSK